MAATFGWVEWDDSGETRSASPSLRVAANPKLHVSRDALAERLYS